MCLQEKQREWAKNALRTLGFEKDANNCREFKMEPISGENEDVKVGNLLK